MKAYETTRKDIKLTPVACINDILTITWNRGQREVSNQYHGCRSREFVAGSDLAVLMQEKLSLMVYLLYN